MDVADSKPNRESRADNVDRYTSSKTDSFVFQLKFGLQMGARKEGSY